MLIVLFVVLGIIFSKIQPPEKPWLDAKGIMKGVIAAAAIGYLVIVSFYLLVG